MVNYSFGFAKEAKQPIQLTIESTNKVYGVRDRYILVVVALINSGKDRIVPYEFFQDLLIVINGRAIPYGNRVAWWGKKEGSIPILNGAKFSRSENIKNFYNINKVGKYSLFLKYKDVTSNIITIDVVEEKRD